MSRPANSGSVYIASPEGHTGKSLVALGVIEVMVRRVGNVGVFRPVVRSIDAEDAMGRRLVSALGDTPAKRLGVGVTYDEVHDDPDAAMSHIIARYRHLAETCDFVVVVGSDYTDVASPAELAFNGSVAANLGAPVLLVVSGFDRTADEVTQVVEMARFELKQSHADVVCAVLNRCAPQALGEIAESVRQLSIPAWALPEAPILSAPLVAEVADALGGRLLFGDPSMLQREASKMLVCAMTTENVLARLEDGQLCIAAGDRSDVLLALAAAHAAPGFPTLAGIVLNGGFRPGDSTEALVRVLDSSLPIVLTDLDSYETSRIVASTRGRLSTGTQRKIDAAISIFEDHIAPSELVTSIDVARSDVVTPLMFEAMLIDYARRQPRRIVLPEGDEERILRATATLTARRVAAITLLGVESQIRAKAASLGLNLGDITIIDPRTSELVEPFAKEYTRLRAHKGMTLDIARDIVRDVSYFATMMVQLGYADGMVSGATHSTAHTITPAFEIIKTTDESAKVSSVFFMCLSDRVLVYGDCAVIPDPTAEELADIAVASAGTARRFGVDPRVAMLSYSTGDSGTGADVEKVRSATELVRRRCPELAIEGPLQYDAAVDASVAETKLPGSAVAGRATVFVFPDLNTGNNTYKAVQRSAGAVAIGPVLQGLRKPVNDLSRGATVRDIINTVAITAAQAQSQSDGGQSSDSGPLSDGGPT
ncbi:MAG: phosphate acetyltransferase [Microthrixaceae bacterium]